MSGQLYEKLTHFASSALAKVKLSSALNPMLWLVGLTMPFGFSGLFLFAGVPQIISIVVVLLPLVTCCLAYAYFAIKDPAKLRSEQYELRQAALNLIKEKGSDISVDPLSIEAVANLSYETEKYIKTSENSR